MYIYLDSRLIVLKKYITYLYNFKYTYVFYFTDNNISYFWNSNISKNERTPIYNANN